MSEGKKQICYFQNNYPKLAFKNYTKNLQPVSPELRVQILNRYEDKTKETVTDVCYRDPNMPYFKWDVPFPKCSKSNPLPK